MSSDDKDKQGAGPPEEVKSDKQRGYSELAAKLRTDVVQSPVFIVMTLMAYIALSGGKDVPVEQKAEFVTTLRKHVTKGDMSEGEMQAIIRDSFAQTQRMEYRSYLEKVAPQLTYGQKLSVIANLYDMMMVDGELREGEESRVELCRRVFDLDSAKTKQIRRVLLLKNDTAIFLNANHPGNDPGFIF